MTLIKSISGIRGTIGHQSGDHLTPDDIVRFTSSFGLWLKRRSGLERGKVVVGRDARISGDMVYHLVAGTLMAMGYEVIHLGLAPTPTVEIAVGEENAQGGIIITASHNPGQWNALKLLNEKGEFLDQQEGEAVLRMAEEEPVVYSEVEHLGSEYKREHYLERHIEMILDLPEVDTAAIASAGFKVVVDGINSVGGIAIPRLLNALSVSEVIEVNCRPDGHFAHNPEPLPEHLTGLRRAVKSHGADVGFVVDPDVDRLAIVNEDGSMFGEEYTLVAVADYILSHHPGNTVSNLSSTKALKELTAKHGGLYYPAAVGEVNVVKKMKEVDAVIGGEGNGGVIYPALHYGRDALVGVALFLSHLAQSGLTCSRLRKRYPQYHISKNKIQLSPGIDVDHVLGRIQNLYKDYPVNDIDGVKIHFDQGWVHLRKSNTEPIIRVYSEADDADSARELAQRIITEIEEMT
jgi:phosphomannomutase